jgi:CelD/BcsL family acetyltransferase involved in cellulose biosynthesis
VDPSADTLGIWSAIADRIGQLSKVDAVVLPHVRDCDPLAPFLRRAPHVVETNSFAAPLLQRSVFGCWETYWNQIPPTLRSNLNRRMRRLSELGEFRFEELTDNRRMRAAWAWILSHKRDWLARKGLDHAFIPTNGYSRFIEATLDISGPTGRRAVFALTLNGEFVAATLVNVDRRRVEGVVRAYDPAFAKFGPGQLLTKELVQWAFAHGLDVDFRIGNEDYKREWASHTTLGSTYVLPRNLNGQLFGAYFALRTWVAQKLSPGWRGMVRLMLGLGSASRIKSDCGAAAACDRNHQ